MAILEKTVLAIVMTGFTHYIDLGKGTDAVIYYENESVTHMLLPGAENALKGEWSLQPDGWFVKWQGGPEGIWHLRRAAPGSFEYLDAKKERRGFVTRIVPGDAEKISK